MPRYSARQLREPTISRDLLSAHLQMILVELVHAGARPEALQGLALLAGSVADAWSLAGNARAVWFRLCGLSSDGTVPRSLLRRLEPQRAAGDALEATEPLDGHGDN